MVPFLSDASMEKRSIKNRWMQRSRCWQSEPPSCGGGAWEVLPCARSAPSAAAWLGQEGDQGPLSQPESRLCLCLGHGSSLRQAGRNALLWEQQLRCAWIVEDLWVVSASAGKSAGSIS